MTKNLRNYSVERLECLPSHLSFKMEWKDVTVRSKGWRDYPEIHSIVWCTVKRIFNGSVGKHYNTILNNLKSRWKDSWYYASTPEDAMGWQADRIITTSLGKAVVTGSGAIWQMLGKECKRPRRYWKRGFYFDENNILCETEGKVKLYRRKKTKQVLLAERRALKAEKKAKEEWALALIATINKPDLLDYALHPRNRNRNQ